MFSVVDMNMHTIGKLGHALSICSECNIIDLTKKEDENKSYDLTSAL